MIINSKLGDLICDCADQLPLINTSVGIYCEEKANLYKGEDFLIYISGDSWFLIDRESIGDLPADPSTSDWLCAESPEIDKFIEVFKDSLVAEVIVKPAYIKTNQYKWYKTIDGRYIVSDTQKGIVYCNKFLELNSELKVLIRDYEEFFQK